MRGHQGKRARGCPSGKVRYRDHQEAVRGLSSMKAKGRDQSPVRAYECPQCQGWHLTSKAR